MSRSADFGTFGRYQEILVEQMPSDMKAAYEFTTRIRKGLPGPHKIWLANPQLLQIIVPTGAYFQTESRLTKAEIEIATNLINGKWQAAYSSYEHEEIGEVAGGLSAEKGAGVDRRTTDVLR
jgi:4-carboxymuconolactone decarboxylase